MSERLIKGSVVRVTLSFLDARCAPRARERIHAALPADVRAALPTIERARWYPLHFVTSLLEGIYREHGGGPEAEKTVRDAGREIAVDATSTFLRLLMKILTPRLFCDKFPEFWRRYHDFGECWADASGLSDKRVLIHATGYDYVHMSAAGWIEHAFEQFGLKGVRVAHNGAPGQSLVPKIVWTVTWS